MFKEIMLVQKPNYEYLRLLFIIDNSSFCCYPSHCCVICTANCSNHFYQV